MARDLKNPLGASKFNTKPMCKKGMKAYDGFKKKGYSSQASNKLASKICNK
tara:strand:- start:1107 stop:1259 length:153 start_codon:yes stop_codon:yes gene_type:complete